MGQGVDERMVKGLDSEGGLLAELETDLGKELFAVELASKVQEARDVSFRAGNIARQLSEKLQGMALAFFRSLNLGEIFDFTDTQMVDGKMVLFLTFNRAGEVSGDLLGAIKQAGCELTGMESFRFLEIPFERLDGLDSGEDVPSEVSAVRKLVEQIVEISPERIVRASDVNPGC